MPANTTTTRRSASSTATTEDLPDASSVARPRSATGDGPDGEGSDANADAPATFSSAGVVLPNLFDRNNALVAPDPQNRDR